MMKNKHLNSAEKYLYWLLIFAISRQSFSLVDWNQIMKLVYSDTLMKSCNLSVYETVNKLFKLASDYSLTV